MLALDCGQAGQLIEGIDAGYLWEEQADNPYAIRHHCQLHGVIARNKRAHEAHLYRHKYWVENAFLWLKRCFNRRISVIIGGFLELSLAIAWQLAN